MMTMLIHPKPQAVSDIEAVLPSSWKKRRQYYLDRKCYTKGDIDTVDHLRKQRLLPLIRGNELADFLGLSRRVFAAVLKQPARHYRSFTLRKKNGGQRRICTPHQFLRSVQGGIEGMILSYMRVHDAAHGYVSGKSTLSCALPHRGKRYLWSIDLQDFFTFVTEPRVVEVFRRVGYPERAAQCLARLCTLRGVLPQGAPTSPALSNQVLLPIDEQLAEFSKLNKVCYTRYADDLNFSSNNLISQEFRTGVQTILSNGGFKIAPKKSRLVGPACQRQVVGLTINEKVSIPRKKRRQIRAMFHRLEQDPASFKGRFHELAGLTNWIKQFHKREGKAYLKRLKKITAKEGSLQPPRQKNVVQPAAQAKQGIPKKAVENSPSRQRSAVSSSRSPA